MVALEGRCWTVEHAWLQRIVSHKSACEVALHDACCCYVAAFIKRVAMHGLSCEDFNFQIIDDFGKACVSDFF